MDDRKRANRFRIKQKQKKTIAKLCIFAAVVIIVFIVAVNWQTIFAPFKDMFLTVGTGEFPVSLSGSTDYRMGSVGENIYLLTDTYIYTYTPDGADIASIQHGFNNPAVSDSEKRVLVYDKNGKDFKVFSKSEMIFSNSMEDTIVFAEMGGEDRSAVITTSTRYSNYLYIFNGEGKQIFRWASPDEKIMRVRFADKGNNIYVSVVGEENGDLVCAVLCFDITKQQGEIWRASTGNAISYTLDCCADGIYTVTEQGAYLFDAATGDLKARSVFTRQVIGVGRPDGLRAVLFHDSASNGEAAVFYNESLEGTEPLILGNVDSFDTDGEKFYILDRNHIVAYDDKRLAVKNYQLDDDYSDMMILNGSAYLLGYNTIQKIRL